MACAIEKEDSQQTDIHKETLTQINHLHDEAHLYVGHGLSCDEQGQTEQAVTLYTKGLRCIDKALDLYQSLPVHDRRLQGMIDKMCRTKQQVINLRYQ